MFINRLLVSNFRIFDTSPVFEVDGINIPDQINEGSGLTVFVGENGCGKSTLLDAMALPLLSYKADSFSVNDFNDPTQKTSILLLANNNFTVASAMPRGEFQAKGFVFEAGVRARGNRAYLSSIVVNDQKFVKADGQTTPNDGSPDLRVNVNNPFKGRRFDENDILFLDKNRTFQTRSGTYNPTRFDRLMEDFDYQYIKKQDIQDHSGNLETTIKEHIDNNFLDEALNKFNEMSGANITLNLLDNWRPFSKGTFGEKKSNNLQVNLNMLGSGYEMIFSLIYSFYLSRQSGKQLIAFIDEPELHMHPSLQGEFVKLLLEIAKESQIVLTSQSPLFVKQLMCNENICVKIINKTGSTPTLEQIHKRVLPYVSANEVNYLAFGLPTVEYHNELYGYIQSKAIDEDESNYREVNFDSYLQDKGISLYGKKWIKLKPNGTTESLDRTIQTYIRNYIHHPENNLNDQYSDEELKESIEAMVSLLMVPWPPPSI